MMLPGCKTGWVCDARLGPILRCLSHLQCVPAASGWFFWTWLICKRPPPRAKRLGENQRPYSAHLKFCFVFFFSFSNIRRRKKKRKCSCPQSACGVWCCTAPRGHEPLLPMVCWMRCLLGNLLRLPLFSYIPKQKRGSQQLTSSQHIQSTTRVWVGRSCVNFVRI